jgi:chemotaxis protein MotB
LFHPLVSQYIAEIIVEGHTDPRSSYLYNLKLSQNRALSVVKFIMSDEFEELEEKNTLRKMLTANGRSFMDLIMREDEPTKADYEKSRRVIFKFRLKSEEQLARIEDAIGQFRNPDN